MFFCYAKRKEMRGEMTMEQDSNVSGKSQSLPNKDAARNEQFVGECLKKIHNAKDAEEGMRQLLSFLGEQLECERVYVFEEMDRQHLSNTYEWCKEGVTSGIAELPYVAKRDLHPWYETLLGGGNIIEPHVKGLQQSDPLIYEFLQIQQIRSIVLSPLIVQGKMIGLLGADNPPAEKMEHISVLFDVLAYFVCSLVNQRELQKLRVVSPKLKINKQKYSDKTILLVDDSPELLKCNARVLRPEGYTILTAKSLKEANDHLEKSIPDAIVLDIDLTDGDGLTFCRYLHSKIDVPVIFLTAHTDAQTVSEGYDAGCFAFLTKPYQLENLRKAVANAVEGKS